MLTNTLGPAVIDPATQCIRCFSENIKKVVSTSVAIEPNAGSWFEQYACFDCGARFIHERRDFTVRRCNPEDEKPITDYIFYGPDDPPTTSQ